MLRQGCLECYAVAKYCCSVLYESSVALHCNALQVCTKSKHIKAVLQVISVVFMSAA